LEALSRRRDAIRSLDELFDENRIDVFFSLSGGLTAAVMAGFPCMTTPIGKTSKGLPIGSFFAARRYGERALLNVAAAIENTAFILPRLIF
jgi:Asp-tRNA(Asn)/Glu-tRNA(Gln) amidotransferase A subunit family amidase